MGLIPTNIDTDSVNSWLSTKKAFIADDVVGQSNRVGQRKDGRGTVFKRQLKITDVEGNKLKQGIVHEGFTDLFDGEVDFIPLLEDTTELKKGEVPIGNTYASSNYLIQAPIKRAAPFGSGELFGLDLNLYHDNINYNMDNTLPDIEIYKFNSTLPDVGKFPSASAFGGNVVVGSSIAGTSASIIENFDGQSAWGGESYTTSTSHTSTKRNTDTGMYLTLDQAWQIQESEYSGSTYGKNTRGAGKGTKKAFRRQYARHRPDLGGYIVALQPEAINKRQLETVHGKRWLAVDFSICRSYYDYDYAVSKGHESLFRKSVLKFEQDYVPPPSVDESLLPVITTADTSLEQVRYTPPIISEIDGERGAHSISTPYFSSENSPPSGSACSMRNTWNIDTELQKLSFGDIDIGYQSQMIQTRIPKPLPLARQQAQNNELDSLVTEIKFNLVRMDKYHKSNVDTHSTEASGHNLTRSLMFMVATRPPDKNEDLASYLYRMENGADTSNTLSDRLNPNIANTGADNEKNLYNGIALLRMAYDKSSENEAGDMRIVNTGRVHGTPMIISDGTSGKHIPYVKKQTSAIELTTGTVLTQDSPTIEIPASAIQRGMIVENKELSASVSQNGDNGDTNTNVRLYSDLFKTVTLNAWNDYDIIMMDTAYGETFQKTISATVPQDGSTLDGYVEWDEPINKTGGVNADTYWWIQQGGWPVKYADGGSSAYEGDQVEVKHINEGIEGDSVTKFDMSEAMEDKTVAVTGNDPPKLQFTKGIHLDAMDIIGKLDDSSTLFQTGEWYTLKIYINGRRDYHDDSSGPVGGYVRWALVDSNNNVVWTRRQKHMGNGSSGMSLESGVGDANLNTGWSFPSYLTIWCNNMAVGGGENIAAKYEELMDEDLGALWEDNHSSETWVDIDSIKSTGFEADTKNATITNNKNYRKDMTIGNSADLPFVDTVGGFGLPADEDGWWPSNQTSYASVGEPEPTYFDDEDITYAAPYYLSWGLRDSIGTHKNKKYSFFLGDYKVSDSKNNDATDDTKRIKFTQSGASSTSDIIAFVSNTDAEYGLGMWGVKDRNHNVNAGIHINDKISIEGKNSVDRFTKKGFWELNTGASTWDNIDETIYGEGGDYSLATMAKRENPWFSTKIVKIWDASKGIIEVSDMGKLNGFTDDEFIIYRAGSAYSTTTNNQVSFRTGLTIDRAYNISSSNKIQLKGSGNLRLSNSGARLLHNDYLHDLYISPYRNWIIIEIYNQAENGRNLLPEKNYGFSTLSNGHSGSGIHAGTENDIQPSTAVSGLTFNESEYSDTTLSSNAWKISKSSSDGGLIEDGTDYGFGSNSSGSNDEASVDSEISLGYIKKYTPQYKWNNINLDNFISVEASRLTKPNEKLNFIINASPETSGVSSLKTLKYWEHNSEAEKGDYEPYFTFYYFDELPKIDNIKIAPDMDNPFYPKITWEAGDDDLWYGFILNDIKDIKHQYQNAVAHIPLNELNSELQDEYPNSARRLTSKHSLFRYDKHYNGYEVHSWRGGEYNEMNVEGLAGNALYCNGVEDVNEGSTINSAPTVNSSSWVEFNCFPNSPSYNLDKGEISTGRPSMSRWSTGGYTNPKEECSILLHFTCKSHTTNRYLISRYKDFNIWIDTNGMVNAEFFPENYNALTSPAITLKSTSIVNADGETPHCVILTFNKNTHSANVKLYIDGKIEAQSGIKNSVGSANNWKDGENKAQNHTSGSTITVAPSLTIGRRAIQSSDISPDGAMPSGYAILPDLPHHGNIEEVVIYNKEITPFIPQTGEFIFTKPVKELSEQEIANGLTNTVKIFIKDYHNIRGTAAENVACSSTLSFRKGGFGLKTD